MCEVRDMRNNVINYFPELRIANLEALPRGTGCNYLECIYAHNSQGSRDGLIAKQWRKREPYTFDAIIRFPGALGYKPHATS